MNYKDSLLYISLIQVSNISAKREDQCWKNGIISLEDLIEHSDNQISFLPSDLEREITYIVNDAGHSVEKIAAVFEEKSGKRDFYRIAYSIPEDVLFLDIETTG